MPYTKDGNFVDTIKEEDDIPPEVNEEFEEHSIDGDYGETLSLMLRKLLYNTPMKEEHPRRRSVFHTRGTSNGKICNLIINVGSFENMVAASLVKILGLTTSPTVKSWVNP